MRNIWLILPFLLGHTTSIADPLAENDLPFAFMCKTRFGSTHWFYLQHATESSGKHFVTYRSNFGSSYKQIVVDDIFGLGTLHNQKNHCSGEEWKTFQDVLESGKIFYMYKK